MRAALLTALSLLAACAAPSAPPPAPLLIGALADCQYADRDPSGKRLYRESPAKLAACVEHLNTLPLARVVHAGDLIDRDFASYDVVLPIVARLEAPVELVLGNHEFDVADEHKRAVPARLGLTERYREVDLGDWRLVVLDGNDLSVVAWPKDSPELAAARAWRAEYTSGGRRAPAWNGALGDAQLAWLDGVLTRADAAGERVLIACHFPVVEGPQISLWNADEVLALLARHPSVALWLAGHHHAGGYALRDGVHHLTLRGMVDTEETAYAVLELGRESVRVDGFGREPDRVLPLARRQ